MVTIIGPIILLIYYTVLSLHRMLKSLLKFLRGNKSSVACREYSHSLPPCWLFLSKRSIMADCPSPFHRARQRRGAPMCGRLQVGRGLVGVLGVGDWRMSLEPINSSLTKHLREISHALLDACTENPLSGSPEMGISLRTHRKHNADERHHMVFERTELSASECSSWQV